jgi:hypothetical protein
VNVWLELEAILDDHAGQPSTSQSSLIPPSREQP